MPNAVKPGTKQVPRKTYKFQLGGSMINAGKKALLPDGLRDGLPPDAAHEANIVNRLLSSFESYGYARVTPPLVEFEDTLLDGAAQSIANATFRLMDPVSQHMMGVRADMTLQVARIATTRLAKAARPLRLAYSGQVLRVRGSQLRPEREFRQAGVELIGAADPAADAEVISLAATALSNAGVSELSVDINLPTLVPTLCEALTLDGATVRSLRAALDRKDADAVAAVGEGTDVFLQLLDATGLADEALTALNGIELPEAASLERSRLADVVALLKQALPEVMITVDPVEHRGFEYHSGLSFTLFARGVRGEVGRGGRYLAGAQGEAATGFSLFLDSLLRAVPAPEVPSRVYLPFGTECAEAAAIRAKGWIAVAGLALVQDASSEAKRLGCSHVYIDGHAVALADE